MSVRIAVVLLATLSTTASAVRAQDAERAAARDCEQVPGCFPHGGHQYHMLWVSVQTYTTGGRAFRPLSPPGGDVRMSGYAIKGLAERAQREKALTPALLGRWKPPRRREAPGRVLPATVAPNLQVDGQDDSHGDALYQQADFLRQAVSHSSRTPARRSCA